MYLPRCGTGRPRRPGPARRGDGPVSRVGARPCLLTPTAEPFVAASCAVPRRSDEPCRPRPSQRAHPHHRVQRDRGAGRRGDDRGGRADVVRLGRQAGHAGVRRPRRQARRLPRPQLRRRDSWRHRQPGAQDRHPSQWEPSPGFWAAADRPAPRHGGHRDRRRARRSDRSPTARGRRCHARASSTRTASSSAPPISTSITSPSDHS